MISSNLPRLSRAFSVSKLDYDAVFRGLRESSEINEMRSLFSGRSRIGLLLVGAVSLGLLSACGGEIDGTKDLFGAIGFKAGADPVVSPGESACGAGTGAGAATSGLPTGRCFSAAEAANAIATQCTDCTVVLTFKGTNETTSCGSIALTGTKLLFGVGSGSSVTAAQDAAIKACKLSEGAVDPSTCVLFKTRCL